MLEISIHNMGLVTALGYNAPSSLAAIRAGISAIGEIPWKDRASGKKLKGAKVDLPQWWEGTGKLADLVSPAIYECIASLDPQERTAIPLLIGVAAQDRPGRFSDIDTTLLPSIEARLNLPSHPYSKLFAADQTGSFHALIEAEKLIKEGITQHVVVAGVDSLLRMKTLENYQAQRRLMTPSNSNGFFPGEAGCAVLVGKRGATDNLELCILGMGSAKDPAPITSKEPFRAQGMTQAIKQALSVAQVSLDDVAYRITDLSGEHYKFKEATFTAARLTSSARKSNLELWHPIEFLGGINAAILPCLLAQAMYAAQNDYAPGSRALCHVGSDIGECAAIVVEANSPKSD